MNETKFRTILADVAVRLIENGVVTIDKIKSKTQRRLVDKLLTEKKDAAVAVKDELADAVKEEVKGVE